MKGKDNGVLIMTIMNNEKLYALSGQIDDRFVEETMGPAPRRTQYLRYLAAAAAVLSVLGAAFWIARAGLDQKVEVNDPETTPKATQAAVLPPAQTEGNTGEASYLRSYDIAQLYSGSPAVCLITIHSWLGENGAGTYFEAEVDRVYKGELPDTIVIFQMGNSNYQMEDSPLFTYGDKLLVGLTAWEHSDYDNAYDIVGSEIAMLYAAVSKAGETYLFDHRGVLSYNTERNLKERSFTNYASDAELVGELLDSIGAYDAAICVELRMYYNSSKSGDPRPLHIYSLEEIEAFFAEAERS